MNNGDVDKRYSAQFKTLRNKFRRYDTIALIRSVLSYLGHPLASHQQEAERLPWVALLAIKWVLADDQAFSRGRQHPDSKQTLAFLSDVYAMNEVTYMPDAYATLHLFMKAMAFQQFPMQEGPRPNRVARQFSLFDSLEDTHYLKQRFNSVCGIPSTDFILMSSLLMAMYANHSPAISHIQHVMGGIKRVFPDQYETFFQFLSTTPLVARSEILLRDEVTKSQGRLPRNPNEFYEQSFFNRRPLLFIDPQLFVVERHSLYRAVEYAIFDALRADNASVFMSSFGPVFERHVDSFIKKSGLTYVTESEVKKQLRLPATSLLIDFVVSEGSSNIFIDAKAAELHYEGKTALSFNEMNRWVNDSLGKAIKQAHQVLGAICRSTPTESLRARPNNYLIVVTYKDLFISNGQRLIECIGKENFDVLLAGVSDTNVIPSSHMYFMTIDDFEALMTSVRDGKITLTAALNQAIEKDSNPSTSCHSVAQHIEQLGLSHCMNDFYFDLTSKKTEERVRRLFPEEEWQSRSDKTT